MKAAKVSKKAKVRATTIAREKATAKTRQATAKTRPDRQRYEGLAGVQDFSKRKDHSGNMNHKSSMSFMAKVLRFILDRHFLNSFRFDINFLFAILFDVAYYAICAGSVMFFMLRIFAPNLMILQNANLLLQLLSSGQEDVLMSEFNALNTAYATVFISSVVLFILLVVVHAVFKGLIWKRLIGMRYSYAYAWRSVVVSFIIVGSYLMLNALGIFVLKDTAFPVFFILSTLLLVHLGYIAYPLLALDDSLSGFFSRLFSQGFVRIYLFILPYMLVCALFFTLLYLVRALQFMPIRLYQTILIVIVISFLSWSKLYVLRIIEKLNPKIVAQGNQVDIHREGVYENHY
ncbi:hypothetical protein JXB31_04055 [Candidatus Woesearchaeota archaeon]|nr:hypothetical protein [Candidatus Woesearchaeota archaeon]